MYGITDIIFYIGCNTSISIIWELIENFWLYKLNIKFAHRRDSLINSITDVIFFVLGGIIALLIIFFYFDLFLIITIVLFYLITILGYYWARFSLKRVKQINIEALLFLITNMGNIR